MIDLATLSPEDIRKGEAVDILARSIGDQIQQQHAQHEADGGELALTDYAIALVVGAIRMVQREQGPQLGAVFAAAVRDAGAGEAEKTVH